MAKKLVLIHPSMRPGEKSFGNTPPLGLAYIAACTPGNWSIRIIDEHVEKIDYDISADLIGITTYTRNANRAYELARHFRRKGITVVLGGIHVSMVPDEGGRYADSVVVGEGETVWPQLIADFERGDLKARYNALPSDPDALPVPRRDLLRNSYEMDAVQTTRGCPFGCEFCCVSAFSGARFKARSAESVLKELSTIKKKFVYFLDDNFLGWGRQAEVRAKQIFGSMIEAKMNKIWITQVSLNFAYNDELLRLAHRSGCRGVFIGIESVDIDNLRNMHKRVNATAGLEGIRNAVRRIQRQGIFVAGGFIFGNDNDDVGIFSKTIDFIRWAALDAYEFQMLTPYPGTKLFKRLESENRLIYRAFPGDWDRCEDNVMFKPKRMNVVDLTRGFDRVIRTLYSRRTLAANMLRTLFHTRSALVAALAYSWNNSTRRQYLQDWQRYGRRKKIAGANGKTSRHAAGVPAQAATRAATAH